MRRRQVTHRWQAWGSGACDQRTRPLLPERVSMARDRWSKPPTTFRVATRAVEGTPRTVWPRGVANNASRCDDRKVWVGLVEDGGQAAEDRGVALDGDPIETSGQEPQQAPRGSAQDDVRPVNRRTTMDQHAVRQGQPVLHAGVDDVDADGEPLVPRAWPVHADGDRVECLLGRERLHQVVPDRHRRPERPVSQLRCTGEERAAPRAVLGAEPKLLERVRLECDGFGVRGLGKDEPVQKLCGPSEVALLMAVRASGTTAPAPPWRPR